MIALAFDNDAGLADLLQDNGNLATDECLETAVLLSLFTDGLAQADDGLPQAARRGWWGDAFADVDGDSIGSRLWLLVAKPGGNTLARAREYAEEALAWLVEDGVASSVVVAAELGLPGFITLSVEIVRPDATAPRFKRTWEVVANAL